MAIHAPSPRLLRDASFRFARAGRGGRKRVDSPIALIPFVDFLLVVVVFLLMTFSAEGVQVPGPLLPEAINGLDLELAPVITIDENAITIDGRRVGNTRDVAEDAGSVRLERLVSDLETQRDNYAVLHPSDDFDGRVAIQAARGTDFRVVRTVLRSAAEAGYGDVALVVRDASR